MIVKVNLNETVKFWVKPRFHASAKEYFGESRMTGNMRSSLGKMDMNVEHEFEAPIHELMAWSGPLFEHHGDGAPIGINIEFVKHV